ncbi:MAG: hypothetical protein JST12_20880 [Armatimonadetes bacterium]|nr:hypothetical protein [Armatimonadota bacterium]
MKSKLLALTTAGFVAAIAHGDLKSDLQKRLDAYAAIIKAKDGKALDKWSASNCAPDFRFVVREGRPYFLKDWLAEEKASYSRSPKISSLAFHIDNLTVTGDKATIKATAKSTFQVVKANGKPATESNSSVFGIQLVKKKGKWLFFEVRQHSSH